MIEMVQVDPAAERVLRGGVGIAAGHDPDVLGHPPGKNSARVQSSATDL